MSHAPLPAHAVHTAAQKRLIKWNDAGARKNENTERVRVLVLLAAAAQRATPGIVNVSSIDFELIADCWEPPLGA
jgi:hypothetical protein